MAEGPAFAIYKDSAGECRWRLVAGNNEIVADSAEGYSTKSGCRSATERVKRLVRDPQLHEHDLTNE